MRCGQKGMCGLVLNEWDMPQTKDGIVPDIIINPHAIKDRMTVNQLLEVILGKSVCLSGHLGDLSPFQNNDIREFLNVFMDSIMKKMEMKLCLITVLQVNKLKHQSL